MLPSLQPLTVTVKAHVDALAEVCAAAPAGEDCAVIASGEGCELVVPVEDLDSERTQVA
jgi:hypothetical protein